MKSLFVIALSLLITGSALAGKVVQTSTLSKASALGQIADKNLAGIEASAMIQSILAGQPYDGRVSVMSTVCIQKEVFEGPKPKNPPTTCSVTIGVDDMNDDDNGWGAIYRLDYVIDAKGTVLGAALMLIAG